ncbi:MAG: hypothetical protein R3B12_05270 [Candidatus Saccharimonadales bacterium]
MYTVNKTRSRKKLLIEFFVVLMGLFVILAFVIWFFVFRSNGETSSNFTKTGGTVAVVAPATVDFVVDEFKISLPEGWVLNGKQNPYYNQVYYEFQSKVKDYENRWLKAYVDVIPQEYALNKLLPITVEGNRIQPGVMSEDCKSFTGAPKPGAGQTSAQTWKATWQDVTFVCDMATQQNHIGTANATNGYNVPIVGPTKGKHTYFFVYIDHNIRPDTTILKNALKSFEAL